MEIEISTHFKREIVNKRIFKIFLVFLILFLIISQNLIFIKPLWSASFFSDSFNDQTKISQTDRISVNTTNGQVTLQSEANSLTNSETSLLTHLGNDSDITSPAIAGGSGGTPTGITYTTGSGGYNGTDEAVTISGNGKYITYPVSGNFNPKKGTIDFWLSFADWSLTGGHTPDYPYEETVLYSGADSTNYIWFYRNWNGCIMMQVRNGSNRLFSSCVDTHTFTANSWHHVTLSWNIEEDTPYVAVWMDGSYVDKNEMADPSPNTFDVTSFTSSFNPTTFSIGNGVDGFRALNGKIDELRITNTEYSLTSYPGKAGILTSTTIDTGVTSPVFGKIKWGETLPAKTDIELQTSASDDGSTWTNWFSANKGIITITFDDGYTGIYNNAYPVISSFGYAGVPYIITSDVGTAGYMTIANLQALQSAGWEMGSHTSTHSTPSVSNLSAAKNWLTTSGFGSNTFSYPGGVFDENAINLVSDYHTTARTIIPQYQTYNTKYRLYSYAGNGGVSDVNSWIDSVVNKKAWGILTFHSIGEPGTPENVSTADFTSILQHISDSGLDVLNMEDALTRLAMYTNNSGDQILSANKRYIRYRAILNSYNGTNAPTLANVQLSAPAKIYKNIATTINLDGTFDHATWPQTTDTSIDNLTVMPNIGSVTVNVNTWNTSGDYSKNWTEENTVSTATAIHTIGDLAPETYYQFKLDGTASTTAIANNTQCTDGICKSDADGNLTFTYRGGYSTHTFALDKDVTSPNAFSLTSPTDNNWTTNTQPTLSWSASSDSGSGLAKYQLYINNTLNRDNIATTTTSITPSSALSDGSYTWYIKAVDNNGNSTQSSQTYIIKIDASAPSSVNAPTFGTVTSTSITVIQPSTVTEGGSGLSTWQARRNSVTELGFNSTTTNSVTDSSLSENTQYTYDAQFKDATNNLGTYGSQTQKYTLADTPTNLIASSIGSSHLTLSVDNLPNATSGLSSYYFSRSGANSGWIQTNSWQDTGLSCGTYTYTVKYRNGDGTETTAISLIQLTGSCGSSLPISRPSIPTTYQTYNPVTGETTIGEAPTQSTPTTVSPAVPVIPSVAATNFNGNVTLEQMKDDTTVIITGDVNQLVADMDVKRDITSETNYSRTIVEKIVKDTGSSDQTRNAITNFITYGTPTTQPLGAGERAGVVNSFKSALGKLPATQEDWNDVIKIANGRWPGQISQTAEDRATVNFKKVYLRNPDRTNPHDDAAITVMAYGLRSANRNIESEKASIKTFKTIYGYTPSSTRAWDVVRAIAYSGATR